MKKKIINWKMKMKMNRDDIMNIKRLTINISKVGNKKIITHHIQ